MLGQNKIQVKIIIPILFDPQFALSHIHSVKLFL